MAHSEQDSTERITAFFEQCRLLHLTAHPSTSIDFDRLNLTGQLKHGQRAHAKGTFSDVFKGETDDGTIVAIKTLRLPNYSPSNEKIFKDTVLRFFREFNHWSQLDHINIVFMCGYSLSDGNISLVSLWHPNGNLVEYLLEQPEASKPDLALDVADGLLYLHTRTSPLVHGDLKGANVLINEHGIACIADFGLSRQIDDLNRQTGFTTTSGATGTVPFTAPELNEGAQFELPCDVYSYGGVILQIYCPGKVPYDYMSNRFQMNQAKSRGEIPQRSSYPEMDGQDDLWLLMSNCWAREPAQRPIMDYIVPVLYRMFNVGTRSSQSGPLRPKIYNSPHQSSFALGLLPYHPVQKSPNSRPPGQSLGEQTFGASSSDYTAVTHSAAFGVTAQKFDSLLGVGLDAFTLANNLPSNAQNATNNSSRLPRLPTSVKFSSAVSLNSPFSSGGTSVNSITDLTATSISNQNAPPAPNGGLSYADLVSLFFLEQNKGNNANMSSSTPSSASSLHPTSFFSAPPSVDIQSPYTIVANNPSSTSYVDTPGWDQLVFGDLVGRGEDITLGIGPPNNGQANASSTSSSSNGGTGGGGGSLGAFFSTTSAYLPGVAGANATSDDGGASTSQPGPSWQQIQMQGPSKPMNVLSQDLFDTAMAFAGFAGRNRASLSQEERMSVVNVIKAMHRSNGPRMQAANRKNTDLSRPEQGSSGSPNQMTLGLLPKGPSVSLSRSQEERQPQQQTAYQLAVQHPLSVATKRAGSPSGSEPDPSSSQRDSSLADRKRARRNSQVVLGSGSDPMPSYPTYGPMNFGPSQQQQQHLQLMADGHMQPLSSNMMLNGLGLGFGNQPQPAQQLQNSNQLQLQQQWRQAAHQRQIQLVKQFHQQQQEAYRQQAQQHLLRQQPQAPMNTQMLLSSKPAEMNANYNPPNLPIFLPAPPQTTVNSSSAGSTFPSPAPDPRPQENPQEQKALLVAQVPKDVLDGESRSTFNTRSSSPPPTRSIAAPAYAPQPPNVEEDKRIKEERPGPTGGPPKIDSVTPTPSVAAPSPMTINPSATLNPPTPATINRTVNLSGASIGALSPSMILAQNANNSRSGSPAGTNPVSGEAPSVLSNPDSLPGIDQGLGTPSLTPDIYSSTRNTFDLDSYEMERLGGVGVGASAMKDMMGLGSKTGFVDTDLEQLLIMPDFVPSGDGSNNSKIDGVPEGTTATNGSG